MFEEMLGWMSVEKRAIESFWVSASVLVGAHKRIT